QHEEDAAQNPEPAGETDEPALGEHPEVLAVRRVRVAGRERVHEAEVPRTDPGRPREHLTHDVRPDPQALGGALPDRAPDPAAAGAETFQIGRASCRA